MWQKAYDQQNQRFNDAANDASHFGLYKSMRDGFDIINTKDNESNFNLYKYSRDSKDELSAQIGALATEVAVLKAVRPYQDALIQCDIRRTAEHADFNLYSRTCRMIKVRLFFLLLLQLQVILLLLAAIVRQMLLLLLLN